MSECPVDEPVGEAARLYSVPETPPEDLLGRLRDRLRSDAELAARFGLLARFAVPDDPDRGAGLFEELVFQDTSELNDSGWLDRIEAISRVEARLAALKAEAVAGYEAAMRGVSADLGHRYPEPGDRDAEPAERRWVAGDLRSVADELALALQLHKGAMTTRILTSCELAHNFPATLRALEEGELTERAAFTIVRELSVLDDPEAVQAAETAVLEWAGKHPLHGLKREAQREAARRSPEACSRAHARAMEERSVRCFPTSDGTAELVHTQDAIDAAAVMRSLNRAAAYRRRHGDPRSLDQLRADIALARLLPRTQIGSSAGAVPDGFVAGEKGDDGLVDGDAAIGGPSAGTSYGDDAAVIGAEATVVIHATGAEIRALIDGEDGTGGEVDHHGPIPQGSLRKHLTRALARTLLGDPAWKQSVHSGDDDPQNMAGDVGIDAAVVQQLRSRLDIQLTDEIPVGDPDRYVPSAAIDRFVRLRDRTCQFPGCNRPAEYADIDHRVAFAAGGRTTTGNLHCLCRHHHRLKHEGGWTVIPNPDGTTTWVSPIGRRYRTPRPEPGDEPHQ